MNSAHKANFQKRVKQGLGAKFPTSRVRFAASTAFAHRVVAWLLCGDATCKPIRSTRWNVECESMLIGWIDPCERSGSYSWVQRFQENNSFWDIIKSRSSSTWGPREISISFPGSMHFLQPWNIIISVFQRGYNDGTIYSAFINFISGVLQLWSSMLLAALMRPLRSRRSPSGDERFLKKLTRSETTHLPNAFSIHLIVNVCHSPTFSLSLFIQTSKSPTASLSSFRFFTTRPSWPITGWSGSATGPWPLKIRAKGRVTRRWPRHPGHGGQVGWLVCWCDKKVS